MMTLLRHAFLISFSTVSCLGAASVTGRWSGAIYGNDGPIPVGLLVNQDEKGVSGSATVVPMTKGAPLENAEIRGDELTFEIHDDLNRVVRFRLALADTALRGEATAGTQVSKVALSRPVQGSKITAPSVIDKVVPVYTEEARLARVEGTVVLYAEVAPDGTARNLRVVRSLGSGLDEKAIECVKQWKFKPGQKEGNPVTVSATIEVNFRLTRDSARP
jgi:TonB family protein